MDPSLFCEVTLDDKPIDDLTEEDIVLLDNDEEETLNNQGSKRPHNGNYTSTPPAKKARRSTPKVNNKLIQGTKFKANRNPHSPLSQNSLNTLSPNAANLLKSSHLSVSRTQTPSKIPPPAPKLKQSITWKYKQLPENQYTADIKKADIRKNYEPEKCNCPKAGEDTTACGSGCINRSTYSECDLEVCVNGKLCTNMAIQKRQYAPGLERFMTAKKGWGVRARQSVAKGSFILEYTGEICSSKEFEKRMLNRYRGDNHHYCLAMDNKTMIDAHRAGSECRFVNHSCAPNCEMEKWNVDGLSRMALFALRDILPGEEICYDYNFSLFNTDQGQECKCGAKECRGVIGGRGKDYLITLDHEEPLQPKTPKLPKFVPNPRTSEDEAWFKANLSTEELDWVTKNAPKPGQLEAKTIKCTVCNECLNFKVQSQCQRHPDLGVIMCMKCRGLYGKGGWDKDPEGNDEFCRWCSEGGQIYLCDFCPHAFCNKCLRWNLGRKYLKKIEDEEKWKCLKCDPSFLREHRSVYWAIFKYHKDKPAKARSTSSASLTPVRGARANNSQHESVNGVKSKALVNSPKVRQQLNGVKPGIRPQALSNKMSSSPGSIHTAYNKLQKNGAISVAPVKPVQHRINGVRPILNKKVVKEVPKHFVDFMLKDADDCIEQFVNMVGEVRKMWKLSRKKDGDVTASTKKLRKILDLAKHNIAEVDKKVVDSYRTNLEDADVRDICPEDIVSEKNKERELEIFAKSKDIDNEDVENVESTPDLPFMDLGPSGSGSDTEPTDSGEIVIDESSEGTEVTGNVETDSDTQVVDLDSEEGIHDMSVEELEVGDETDTESADNLAVQTDLKVKDSDKESDAMNELNKEDSINDVDLENAQVDALKDTEPSKSIWRTEEVVEKLDTEEEEASKVDVKIEVKIEDFEESKTIVKNDDNPANIDIKDEKFDYLGIDGNKENIGTEIKTEKEVKEKDAKITIEYKNDASPIKDQKDIVKESIHEKLRTEHLEEIVGENASKPTSGEKTESVLNDNIFDINDLSQGKDIGENSNVEEDEVIIKEIEVSDISIEEETEGGVNPGDKNSESKFDHEINGLDSEEPSEEIRNVVKGLIETCIATGPEDSKSTETCHESSADNPCEESVTDPDDKDDLKST